MRWVVSYVKVSSASIHYLLAFTYVSLYPIAFKLCFRFASFEIRYEKSLGRALHIVCLRVSAVFSSLCRYSIILVTAGRFPLWIEFWWVPTQNEFMGIMSSGICVRCGNGTENNSTLLSRQSHIPHPAVKHVIYISNSNSIFFFWHHFPFPQFHHIHIIWCDIQFICIFGKLKNIQWKDIFHTFLSSWLPSFSKFYHFSL